MSVRFCVEGKGEASLESVMGERIQLRATFPAPPGSVLRLTFCEADAEFKVKVRQSRKNPGDDASYAVEGRLVDATRRVLELLSPS